MSYQFKGDNKALVSSITALLALDAKGALAPHGIGEMARDLLETCAARLPAEQHQDEPVAMPMRRSWSGIAGWKDQAEIKGWNACLDEIAKLGPLYTHADPGEVEALRGAYLRAGEREHELRTENAALRKGIKGDLDLDAWLAFTKEAPALRQLQAAFNEWVDKSQWARKGAAADELGMHLADVIKQRYDQLQADLTARDQRIDVFESQLLPDLHSRPEERGTPETEPCSGCGTPGWNGTCDKCIPY